MRSFRELVFVVLVTQVLPHFGVDNENLNWGREGIISVTFKIR